MRIELICTGDEVLTGKIVNTNFAYISQKLEDVGLAIRWETTVGDDRESLLRAFQLAGERADAVIVNGGLGPPSTISRRRSPRRPPGSSWSSTRSGWRAWRTSSAGAAG